jgi:hypothetical protein
MPINVKGLFETLQYKANNIDSSTSTAEILDTLKAIKLADGNTVISYDSDGALPTASTSNVKLAYVKNTGVIKFNNGTWDTLTGSLDGTNVPPYTFQGSISGYISGGYNPTDLNTIEKFSLSADQNATDVGDLTRVAGFAAGQSSSTNGYTTAGAPAGSNVIEKFPFSVDANATDVGDLTEIKFRLSGQSSSTSGYTAGGFGPPQTNVIEKFPFSADANATDVGDLTYPRSQLSGQSSADNGYASGGTPVPTALTRVIIEKFPFTTDANAADVGDMTAPRDWTAGQSSVTNGYISGGQGSTPLPTAYTNIIDKFSFSTDANATDVGDLIAILQQGTGQSSTTDGYASGGRNAPSTYTNVIQKFSFATDANASDVGDLTQTKSAAAGQQV